jgi:hypothetical protein
LTVSIQQAVIEFSELASVSPTLMKQLEPFFLYQALGEEFYHLKKQIKSMKQSNINPEKIWSLINSHSVILIKSSASLADAKNNKWKASHEGQFSNQSNQGQGQGYSSKRRKTNQEN